MNIIVSENLKKIKKINFLSELEKKEIISQNVISKKIFVSLGMVTFWLLSAECQGFFRVSSGS